MTARLATVCTAALVGTQPRTVRIEAALSPGLPLLRLVGLPDTAVREAGDRVRAAIQRSGLAWPSQRLVVNLAPADLPKAGSGFDVPLAVAVLAATGQVPEAAARGAWACGELGLDGSVRPVPGLLAIALGARRLGADRLLVPRNGAGDAALVDGLEVVPVASLGEVVAVLRNELRPPTVRAAARAPRTAAADLADVRGQAVGRRALEVAAAGGHHLLLSGPPGCGKTLLARRLVGLLPDLDAREAVEVAALHALAGERAPDAPLRVDPPVREPHHGVTVAALVGGGAGVPRPGELTLAHRGVLVLDELLETPRAVLDALRGPLERGRVELTRSRARVTYPARAQLVATTNPCPCGHHGSPQAACGCRPDQLERYRSRLSGPLRDRFDLAVELRPVGRDALVSSPSGEPTARVAARVAGARAAAASRWPGSVNARVASSELRATVRPTAVQELGRSLEALDASARAFDRCLRVARTLADLEGLELVDRVHVQEAVAYRLAPA